jgi:pimeloyl-ACP methyl ester carboxylesterase
MKIWITYISLGIFTLILFATTIGAVYEMLGRTRAMKEFPPPGKLVNIGGRNIQLDCRGTGSPTVVFESGLDLAGSLSWSAVHDEIAKTTRACAYSRAGIMWSDSHDAIQNGKSIAEDLHATLKNAGEQGPFILVGHSLGGPYIMTYTKYFGAEVVGLVFVDASHPDQEQRFKAMGTIPGLKMLQLKNKIGAALNWTGLVRAVVTTNEKMPHWTVHNDQAMKAFASTSLGPMLKENDSLQQTLSEVGTFRQLGNRPLYVLTAMAPMPKKALAQLKITAVQAKQRQEIWKEMQDEQATWSSQSQHQLVPDAGHYIQFDRPDIVIAAVRSVIGKVRENWGSP